MTSGGDPNRSRPRKAGNKNGGGGGNGKNQQQQGLKLLKKKSKDRKGTKENNSSTRKSSSMCVKLTKLILICLIGAGVYTSYNHPEKVQEAFSALPPEVQNGLAQAKEKSLEIWSVVSVKSIEIASQGAEIGRQGYSKGAEICRENYAKLPPQVKEYTDPALDATVKYSLLAKEKVISGYDQASDFVIAQYTQHSPTVKRYYGQAKDLTILYGGQAYENSLILADRVKVWSVETYATVSPKVQLYYEITKENAIIYGGIAWDKTKEYSQLAYDKAKEGWAIAKPKVMEYGGSTFAVIQPYWEVFYNNTMEHYHAGMMTARLWTREMNIGEVNLEQLLFAEEIRQEELKKAEDAVHKIKAAVEAMNKKKAEDDAKKAEEDKLKAEYEAQLKAEAEEAEAKKKAEAEAKRKAEEEAKHKAEEERKKKAEAEAKAKAEAEAKAKAEAEAKKKAEEDRKKAEAEAKRKAEEEAKKKAEAEAKQKAEAEAKKKAEDEAKKKAEAEAKKKAAEEEAKKKAAEEERKKAEAEAKAKKAKEEDAKKKKAEAEAKKKAEAEAKRKADEEEAAKKKKAAEEADKARIKAAVDAKVKEAAEAEMKKRAAAEEAENKRKFEQKEAVKKADDKAKKAKASEQQQPKQKDANVNADKKPKPSSKTQSILKELAAVMSDGTKNHQFKVNAVNGLSDKLDTVAKDASDGEYLYAKAETLSKLAELKQSNPILEDSIKHYSEVLALNNPTVTDNLFKMAAREAARLMKFRGWTGKAAIIQKQLVDRFPDELEHRHELGVYLLTMGNNAEAKDVFNNVLTVDPMDAFAKAHLGFILKSEALPANDTKVLEQAVDLMRVGVVESQGQGQDLQGLFYFHLGDGLRRLKRSEEADEIFQLAVDREKFPSFWQRSLYNEPNLKAQPIWTAEELRHVHEFNLIKAKWEDIRQEALDILKAHLYVTEGENLKDTGHWAQYDLFVRGKRFKNNCDRAPVTCTLIEAMPEVASNRRGQVKFSVMQAGTHVHPHTGPTNCRLRAHLGLDIPEGSEEKTSLRVADKFLTWSNGEIFVFDDSFDHEVWHENDLGKSRVILIFDLWHPDLSPRQKATLPAI